MHISTEQIGRILESHFNKIERASANKPPAPGLKSDQATFSAKAEEIDLAMRVIARLPDVRADRVAELRSQIAKGTFRISSDTIAEKILAEARLTKLLGS
ncbi:MAG: flagellar biosynthesis anti-sigma factor FlgM [Armatimonadetes bacterium]|nr:flagellar biosynthesis anti-sigma factor FlgM [Armatimonadota bacterium]NIM68227.1 flagellar biosynthesis anti-sigma factor FlgM [Armatimonadota bacterium]NIN06432.1 flagellar biosynthesis anti-sigma factor FlgM [Armatimonadota bacterium]NIO76102.1 flagellar biosynthesis anti-sigma factor FlgM [Armatimonadota bacterium]NIO98007.1 flagellar biosynthesis anti-sigma factor FlgM [Armatimonadota bacterium]